MNRKSSLFAVLSLLALGAAPVLAAVPPVGEPELVLDLRPGVASSTPISFTRVGDLAFFLAGPERALWRTDGSTAGTFLLHAAAVNTIWPALGGNLAWFLAADPDLHLLRLWRSDGTPAGTFPVSPALVFGSLVPGMHLAFVPEKGLLFFAAATDGPVRDHELWVTDGTAAGTSMIDLNPGGSSHPGTLTSREGRVYFLAGDASGRSRELWTSDGTAAGTFQVKDLQPGDDGIRLLVRLGDRLVLVAARSDAASEVWRSDGTEAGTVRVAVIPAPAAAFHSYGTVSGARLFFALQRQTFGASELWVTDGTAAGTVRLLEGVSWEANHYWEMGKHAAGDGIFFALSDAEHGLEPWWSDGTPSGTKRIADLCPGPCSSSPSFGGIYGGRAFFSASDGASGREPWLTNGTAAGTAMADLCPGSCDSHPVGAKVVEGVLFFGVLASASADGQEVWASDGTAAGTRAVTAFTPKIIFSQGLFSGAALPGRVVFAADDGAHGSELWTLPVDSDPPPAGEWLASSRVPGFRFQVRIGGVAGTEEPVCLAETLCVNGALPGRPEVFLRVGGPRPNGYLWPAIVTLSTSPVEVLVEQTATGQVRQYRLDAPGPADRALPGILDRTGFLPASAAGPVWDAARGTPRAPSGAWADAGSFRVKARVTSGRKARNAIKAPCAAETLCLSMTGAPPGPPDLLVRIAGPKPNGYLWPMVARFTTASAEVWIQQKKTGVVRYYRLPALPAGGSDLDGVFDPKGFRP